VVLVLLIIFLGTMPRQLRVTPLAIPPPDAAAPAELPIQIHVAADLAVTVTYAGKERTVPAVGLATALRDALAGTTAPMVFVGFDDPVRWSDTVAIMDTVRGLATDPEHNGITVALANRPTAAPR
jgi:biopolymer transport protein ExbD